MRKITPCLWFNRNAEEAARFYVSIFPNSKIMHISHFSEEVAQAARQPVGSVLTVLFELDGNRYMALNGGPQFQFTPAISMMIYCDNQQEIDDFWEKLTAGGGKPGQCGWLEDKFGISWQVVPKVFDEMMQDKDPKKSAAVMKAMLPMKKFDIAILRKAYEAA
jgi:predicted 3-demethylubiquinone-9 3-methyltransferase (glyoxalase superfamily)